MMNSPRLSSMTRSWEQILSAIPLTGLPKNGAMCGDQSTRKPMFAGFQSVICTPFSRSQGTQAPSEPSRCQLAPPRARMVTLGERVCGPVGVSNVKAAPSKPVQRQRLRISTPWLVRRFSQARRRGEAFIATGKTRPEEPVYTSWPRARHQFWTLSGPKSCRIGRRWGQS